MATLACAFFGWKSSSFGQNNKLNFAAKLLSCLFEATAKRNGEASALG